MGKGFNKKFWSVVFTFILLIGGLAPAVSAESSDGVNYLALGDSLAAGVSPENTISSGYADLTADAFKEENLLGTYSKEFAVSGYTTQNVLDDLTTKSDVQAAIAEADLITISAGANDLLKEGKFDPDKNIFELDQAVVPAKLQTIAENYAKILQAINTANPDAEVYVMGYYFPFPYIADEQKPQLIELTQTLNQTIQTAVTAQGATFVPIYDKFGDGPKQYIPSPTNIHPNIAGYQLMSDALIETIANSLPNPADVPEGYWAEYELNIFLENGLFTLDDAGKIYPEKAITRAEVADILYNMIPLTQSIPENPGFIDVPKTHPAYMAIAKLTEAGVFAKDEYFHPNDSLNRVQMAKVLSIAFQLKGDGAIPTYKDINATYWAAPYIDAVTDAHLMIGYKNGTFGLYDPINRAQFAVVMVRVTNQILQ